ncbi:diguanylate cyclase [Marinobacterium sp. D7]|uniref:sensor domain-containing diguanylate cyclase n=1 Tax=Marinobacterium ramblicola TaxID=2849041 RepID=UPI001C2D954C|nr:diguanylate cyclase [Marinobacterium ramblicola]MBV1790112.1 diguanylate cyclase [Marinobacterium ramblicola]
MAVQSRSLESHRKINPVAILALTGILIAALWSALIFEQGRNYEDVSRHSWNDAGSVARTFEEHVARTFNNIDAVLLVLRQAWVDDRSKFETKVRIMQAAYDDSLLVQIAVIDANGKLAYSNLDPDAAPVDLSDREHFRVHRDRSADELHISKPVKGRVSGRYSIQLTRPIWLHDDRFGGVLVISLNPSYFSGFFGSLDLDDGGSVALIGLDGVVRARGINLKLDESAIGKVVPGDRPFMKANSADVGTFEAASVIDGVKRRISYRRMNEYPMVVTVTKVTEAVFAEHNELWLHYKWGAAAVSVLLLAAGTWLARAVRLQYQLKAHLLVANDSLRTLNTIAIQAGAELGDKFYKALELGCKHLGVEMGVVGALHDNAYVVDKCYSAVFTDLKEGDELELPAHYSRDMFNSRDVVIARRDSQSHGASLLSSAVLEHECFIGTSIWVGDTLYGALGFYSTKPYAQEFDDSDREFVRLLGRWVGSSITEDRAVKKLTALATTDSLTGAKSRGYFTAAVDDEINRAHRYRRPLSLILVDLDYFKHVNDLFGHHAGDETLRHFSGVVQGLLRTTDLFARLGGEEFAILMPETQEHEATIVAERLRISVSNSKIETPSGDVQITISAGIAQLKTGEDFKTIYNRADSALYKAKSLGRNRVELAGSSSMIGV